MDRKRNLVFLGCSGNFQKFMTAAEVAGYRVLGIIDEHYHGSTESWSGVPILGTEKNMLSWLSRCPSDIDYFVSVPLTMRIPVVHEKRLRLIKIVDDHDLPCANLIASNSNVAESAVLSKGVWVGHYSVVQDQCVLGDHVWVRDLCFIGHDTRVGKGTSISTQSYTGSYISVGEHTTVGIKALVSPRLSSDHAKNLKGLQIGHNSMIHPGAIVHDDVGTNVEMRADGSVKPRPNLVGWHG